MRRSDLSLDAIVDREARMIVAAEQRTGWKFVRLTGSCLSRLYLVARKLDDINAFTLYNCETVAATPVRPAYLIKAEISVAPLCSAEIR